MERRATRPAAGRRGSGGSRRRPALWRVGRSSRWLLHASVLVTIGLVQFLPSAVDSRSVRADSSLLNSEVAWLRPLEESEAAGFGPSPLLAQEGEAMGEAQATSPGLSATPTQSTPTRLEISPTPTPIYSATPMATPTTVATATAVPTKAQPAAPKAYQVAPGDTLFRIADRFGVSANTILWANGISDPNNLTVGQTLTVLPTSGIAHQVQSGESLSSIAALYGVSVSAIVEANDISSANTLQVGQTLVIAGGRPPTPQPTATPRPSPTALPTATATRVPPTATPTPRPSSPTAVPPTRVPTSAPRAAAATPAAKGNGQLAWPVSGLVTQQFGERGHQGIDIATGTGTPIRAAADGKVVKLEQLTYGYGWFLVVDHGNGIKTLYSHLSAFNVKMGDTVKRGQQIGSVGATGLATGPHLHFEVSVNGQLVNPVSYL